MIDLPKALIRRLVRQGCNLAALVRDQEETSFWTFQCATQLAIAASPVETVDEDRLLTPFVGHSKEVFRVALALDH